METTEMPQAAFVDRRAYERLKIKLPIVYGLVEFDRMEMPPTGGGESSRYVPAQTDNISANGLAFLTGQDMPIGTKLELKIELPDQGGTIQCLSRVVRTAVVEHLQADARVFLVGVTFLAITSDDRKRIEKFCEENKTKAKT
jgi:c-di-GMP-binding flagellar brake protein YcgR